MSAVFMRSIDYWFQIMHYRYNTTPIPNDIYILFASKNKTNFI